MKVIVHTSDGAELTIAKFDDESVLDLVEEFREGDSAVLQLQMDEDMVYVARRHIVRIDVEP